FGPEEGAYGRPGFARLVEWLSHEWHVRRAEVEQRAEQATQALRQMFDHAGAPEAPDVPALARDAFNQMSEYYDDRAGGFFQAPKFPHEAYLLFLLSYARHTGSDKPLQMVTQTLHRMAGGGIHDHVAGGFHRYAVDRDWLVPHFEKMLYTQALLALCY